MDGCPGKHKEVRALSIMKLISVPEDRVRSLGDLKYKPFGVTPEPEVRSKLLKGQCIVLFLSSRWSHYWF